MTNDQTVTQAGERCPHCGSGSIFWDARHRTAHSGEGRSNGAGEFVVAGPWEHHDETSGETHWSAEVQIVGGHESAAEVFGATAGEAKHRADMIAAVLSAPQGEVERLRAENERLTRAVGSGMLNDLLTPDESDEFVKFIQFLRGQRNAALAQPEAGGEHE